MLACNPLPTSFPALTLLTFWVTFCVIFYLTNTPDYKDQVIEIMQEPKQYILKLEGETDNEQH